jgi:hypothetical protein
MELVERYLLEIRRYLRASDDRDDVLAEIADDVQSELESRAEELGRPMTSDEVAALITDHGHPRIVALWHRPQRYLIGPLLFPFYTYVLRLVVLAVVILDLLGATIAAVVSSDPFPRFIAGTALLWPGILYPVVAVTIMFATAEWAGLDESLMNRVLAYRWDPRTLPLMYAERLSRAYLLIEAFVLAGGALWLLGIPAVRESLLGATWHWFFVAIFFATALIVVADAILAVRPELTRVRPTVLIVANTICLVGTALTIPSGSFLRAAHANPSQSSSITDMNHAILWMVATLVLISVIQIVTNAQALLHHTNAPEVNTVHGGLRA